jgi:hypothetical protein
MGEKNKKPKKCKIFPENFFQLREMRIFQGRIWIYVQEKDIHEIREWYYVGPMLERIFLTRALATALSGPQRALYKGVSGPKSCDRDLTAQTGHLYTAATLFIICINNNYF